MENQNQLKELERLAESLNSNRKFTNASNLNMMDVFGAIELFNLDDQSN